jgi:hypothetical protein
MVAASTHEETDSAQPANFCTYRRDKAQTPSGISQMLARVHVLGLCGIGKLPLVTAERIAETRHGKQQEGSEHDAHVPATARTRDRFQKLGFRRGQRSGSPSQPGSSFSIQRRG